MHQSVVWHIASGGDSGGAKTHILSLLPRLEADSFKIKLICLGSGALSADAANIGLDVEVLPMAGIWDMAVIGRLCRRLRAGKPAIVHTHGVRANLCGRVAARLAGVPFVVTTVHSLASLDYRSPAKNWLSSWVDRRTAGLSDRLIAVSRGLADNLRSQGVPDGKLVIIHNGIDTSRYAGVDAAAVDAVKREFGISPGERVVGVIGRLVPVKAYSDFLRAAAAVAAPGVKFMVVGNGPDAAALHRLARSLGITDRVIFTGFRRDIPRLVSSFDVFVISSLSEGLPLVLLEAMAAGKPVVSTAVGGVPEVVTSGVQGILVEPRQPEKLAAAIMAVLQDAALAQQLGRQGKALAESEFNIDRTVAATAGLYRELLPVERE